jgi:CRISPR-associated protein Csb1
MLELTGRTLTLSHLKKLVAEAVAIRGTATLQPVGGQGDKVFPPTHSVDKAAKSRYAFERRRIDGQEVECVLLDSVQSQANRMEEALEELWMDRRIVLPVIGVDLSECAPDVGLVTSLSAPHRIVDALLRDSFVDGTTLFRLSDLGRSFADATPKNAAPLFKVCPTGLVFGLWDSTGPKRGLGAKFARALVSEIVGINAVSGVKTASRIDPTGIVTRAAEVLTAADPQEVWTHDPSQAKQEKGKPVKFGDGKVSEVNHSNVPPTIDTLAGGVTIDKASQVVVLSLVALRNLRFGGGDQEARTVLAALALLAVVAAEQRGYDLRSRCMLVPSEGEVLRLQAVHRDGTGEEIGLTFEDAIVLYRDAIAELPEGLRFSTLPGEPIAMLTPSPKLAHLVRESHALAATGDDGEGV